MKRPLTNKQKMFVKEYLCDLNATQSAIRAGYSAKTASWIGPQLLGKTHVAEAIQADMNRRSAKIEISGEKVLQELAKLSFSDVRALFDRDGRLLPVHMLPDSIAASVSSVEVVTSRVPGTDPVEVEYTSKIRFWDKRASLELLGKHLVLFTDKGKDDEDTPPPTRVEIVVRDARRADE